MLDMIPFLPINLNARIEAGAIPFADIVRGGRFFFGGQYTYSNTKVGDTTYQKPFYGWNCSIRPETLVYPA